MIVCMEITQDDVLLDDIKTARKKEEMFWTGHH